MNELIIKNLHVEVEGKEILKGINLEVKEGEIVALLGPNGHGKSTLLASIMGNPRYIITKGSISFNGKNVLELSVDERSKLGIFLGFQNPVEVPGVICADFYKAALNSRSTNHVSLYKYYSSIEQACKEVGLPFEMVNRSLNDGFSGGEKKRNEILQMILLKPSFVMLDEIDSGLDVDAINVIGTIIRKQNEQNHTSFLIISHYARLFDLIHPTRSVVIIDGKIAIEGGVEIIEKIDKNGYTWIKNELGIDIEEQNKPMNKVSLGTCAIKESTKDDNK